MYGSRALCPTGLEAGSPRSPTSPSTLSCFTVRRIFFRKGHVQRLTDRVSSDSYMLSLTMLGSVILYGGGNLKYIDALFFASGAATQSGLNTYVLGFCAAID